MTTDAARLRELLIELREKVMQVNHGVAQERAIGLMFGQARAIVERLEREAALAQAEPPPEEQRFSDVNLARCTAPDGFGHALESWSIAEWTNAMAGEAGEACNLAKKLLRHRDGVAGNKKAEDKDVESLRLRCAEELADVVIYADLAMRALGYDLNETVRRVFNRKSDELGA